MAGGEIPLVVVVVLNWNGWDDTIECLASLNELSYARYEVIVVDNGSTDPTPGRLHEEFPGVEVLRRPTNLGFAGGNNVGIRHALERGADFVWLLNNDTTVAPDALDALVEVALAGARRGVVGAVLYRADARDRVEAWGGGNVQVSLGAVEVATAPRQLDFVCGASMLVRREVFDEIGLFDERFFFFMEDVDFSRRATSQGWRVAVADDAAVWHKVGASVDRGSSGRSVRADRLHARAAGVFVGKHAGWLLPVAAPARLGAIAVRRARRGEFGRLPELAAEFVRGVRTGFGGRGT